MNWTRRIRTGTVAASLGLGCLAILAGAAAPRRSRPRRAVARDTPVLGTHGAAAHHARRGIVTCKGV